MAEPSLRILAPRAKLRVQTWSIAALQDAQLRAALQELVGDSWPTTVGATAGSGSRPRSLCLGPTEWLVVAESPADALLREVEQAVRGSSLNVTDQSQGLAALEVSGPRARELITKGCCLDLHPRAFPLNACARTRLAHVPVVIDAGTHADRLTCYVARSYLDYLHRWLIDAAAEFQDTNA